MKTTICLKNNVEYKEAKEIIEGRYGLSINHIGSSKNEDGEVEWCVWYYGLSPQSGFAQWRKSDKKLMVSELFFTDYLTIM